MMRKRDFLLALVAASLAPAAQAQASAREVSHFEAEHPALSIAYLDAPAAGAGLLFIAYGQTGLAAYSRAGAKLWSDPAPTRIVAASGVNLLAYRDGAQGGSLTRYGVGHGGGAILPIGTQTPSPVAATTLLRSGFAALGPIGAEGETLRGAGGSINLGRRFTCLTATRANLQEALAHGALIVGGAGRRVSFYPLGPIEAALRG